MFVTVFIFILKTYPKRAISLLKEIHENPKFWSKISEKLNF